MKLSKISQRLFNVLVAEIRNEMDEMYDADIAFCDEHFIAEVLERHGYTIGGNPDHLTRLYRACDAYYKKAPLGVVSLTAQQMQPVIADDWWLHTHEEPAPLEKCPLDLQQLAEKIGQDLAQLDWECKYASRTAGAWINHIYRDEQIHNPIAWDNNKFMQGVLHELRLGGLRSEQDVRAMHYMLAHPVTLVAHGDNYKNTLTIEGFKVGIYDIYDLEVHIKTHTHRKREWRCGRAVACLLVNIMQRMSRRFNTETPTNPAKDITPRGRQVPDVGIDPRDLTVALKRGVYLEYGC